MDLRKDVLYYDALVDFPAIGQENKLYLNKADGSLYYWDGAAYQLAGDGSGGVTSVTASAPLASSGGATPNISLTVPGNTTTFLRGDGTFATPPAGGLTKFTEAEATTSPNNTVYVDSLSAAGSTTNVDVAIVPKGTGAFMLDIPDNTAAGGNKRGANAVDLQTSRINEFKVASGAKSIVLAGNSNTSSGTNAISGGDSSTASGDHSVALGNGNSATGSSSVALGWSNTASFQIATALGYANTASGNASFSAGSTNISSGAGGVAIGWENTSSAQNANTLGRSNVANGDYSTVIGYQGHSFGIYGRQVYASGQEGTSGDAQASKFVLHERTTGNTATTLTTNSSAASTNNQVILSNQSAYRFKGSIVGKQSGSTNAAVWDIDGFIVRGANAAATTLNVSNVTLVENTPAWGTPTLAADTTNGGLQVQVTGAAATNIQWTAVIETTEVIYA